jgi:hypothetical protein
MAIEYKSGSELPNPELEWKQSDGVLRDFATGWTFLVRVGTADLEALIEKTTGITGSGPTAPNVLIEWDPDELDVLPNAVHTVDVEATFTSTGQSITLSFEISKTASILPLVP